MKYDITIVSKNDNDNDKYLLYFDTEDSEIVIEILAQFCEVLNDRYERKVSDNLF